MLDSKGTLCNLGYDDNIRIQDCPGEKQLENHIDRLRMCALLVHK